LISNGGIACNCFQIDMSQHEGFTASLKN
jgi:hypothetical protein